MPPLANIPPATGGSPFGWHYLQDWKSCPTRWFNRYLRPHPEGGLGCESRLTPAPLLIGSAVHEGLAAWYQSGWQDGADTGRYDLDTSITSALEHMTKREDELEAEQRDKATVLVKGLLERYHYQFGPDGLQPDFPSIQVAADVDGNPLIEREFWLQLDYRDYIFTARADALVWFESYLTVLEHKTSAGSGVSRLFQRMALDGQATGLLWILRSLFPEEPWRGLLVNCLVKDRGARSQLPSFMRDITSRNEHDLEKFKLDTTKTLKDIDDHVEQYRAHLERGMTPSEAAFVVFDAHPPAQECVGFSPCTYYNPCKIRGSEDQLYANLYRPRSRERQNPLLRIEM